MHLPTYTPATDDLYTYDASNSGWPTGWNPSHALYPYRSQLTWVGVRSRSTSLAQSGGELAYTYQNNAGAGESLAQKPNWFNPRLPALSFVAPRLAIGAIHFWDAVINRVRPATVGLGYTTPVIRTLDADGSLRTFANANFRGTWNQEPSGTYRANQDCGLAELELGDPHPGPFPTILRTGDRPFDDEPIWFLEGNGRAVQFTLRAPGYTGSVSNPYAINPKSHGPTMQVLRPSGVTLYTGDSGGIYIIIRDGAVFALGHTTYAGDNQMPWANVVGDPDLAHLAGYGHAPNVTSFGIDYPYATETDAADCRDLMEESQELLEGLV